MNYNGRWSAYVAGCLTVAFAIWLGCNQAQRTELKTAEVTVVADANTLCSLVMGAAAVAAKNPVLTQAIATEVGTAAAQLATKAGVSADEAAVLRSDLSNPANIQTVAAVAATIKARIAAVAPTPSPSPSAGP